MDSKTKEYLKTNLLQPIYKNFADTVALERKIPNNQRKEYFEGKVFIAGDKKVQGILVDEIISYPEMVSFVKREQNIKTIKKLEYKQKVGDIFSKLLASIEVLIDKKMEISFQ
jgi:ClpP class serine protease